MTGGEKLLIGGAVGAVLLALYASKASASTAPVVPVSTTLVPPSFGLSTANINRIGAGAGVIGNVIGSSYLGPIGRVAGASARTDTVTNIAKTQDAAATLGSVVTGRTSVTSGIARIGGDVAATAISPIKSIGHALGF
jgi:hypothetical protein